MEEIAKSVDTTNNNIYDGGHKYVLGPTQNYLARVARKGLIRALGMAPGHNNAHFGGN